VVKALIRLVLFLGVVLVYQNSALSAGQVTTIPVPKNIIYAGQVITDQLLRGRIVPLRYLAGVSVIENRMQVVGKIARTTLMPSRPIATNHITEPDVIKVNKPTMLIYTIGMLKITAEVLPLNSAKAGEFVRARNIRSGRIISGVAMTNGTIIIKGT